MPGGDGWVVVGVDNGGTANNGTVLDAGGRFLLDRMAEIPSYVREGPGKAIQALVDSVDHVLGLAWRCPGPRSGRWAWTPPVRPAATGSCPPGAPRTSPTRSGGASTSAAGWRTGSACR